MKSKIFSTAYVIFKNEAIGQKFLKSYDKIFIDHIGCKHKPILEIALFQYFPSKISQNEMENTYENGFYL